MFSGVLLREENLEALCVQDWGLLDYQQALTRQLDLVALVHQELARETLVVCTHPPVVTLGRGTEEGDVHGWSGEVIEVNRGGRATYHGPNQIVVYPIIDLNLRGRDLHKYFRALETAVVATLSEYGIEASGRSLQVRASDDGSDETPVEATGVWIGSRKIASIGIGVRKWVTFHGLAFNVEQDETAFQGLKPCGFTPQTMISLEEVLSARPCREVLINRLSRNLQKFLRV